MATGDLICPICGNYESLCRCSKYITMSLNELRDKAIHFSDTTFGKGRSPKAPTHHLIEEVEELLETLKTDDDPETEFADCFLLLIDAFRMHYGNDVDMQKLIDISSKKLDICYKRKWGEPDENGVVKHIPDETEEGNTLIPKIDKIWFKNTFESITKKWMNGETIEDIIILPLTFREVIIKFTFNAGRRYGVWKNNTIKIIGAKISCDFVELIEGSDVEYQIIEAIKEKISETE
jgi:hypothetical protein